jgi:hypothetical protein
LGSSVSVGARPTVAGCFSGKVRVRKVFRKFFDPMGPNENETMLKNVLAGLAGQTAGLDPVPCMEMEAT